MNWIWIILLLCCCSGNNQRDNDCGCHNHCGNGCIQPRRVSECDCQPYAPFAPDCDRDRDCDCDM